MGEDPSAIVRLRSAREELPTALREEILALGDAAVAPLLAVLDDDDEALGDWAPIHAVDLLADLKAERAIAPMLDVLVDSDWDHIIHDRLLQRLPSFSASIVEPTLALVVAYDDDEDVLHSLATVLASCGVRDARVFALLERIFDDDITFGAMLFRDYGDARALPLLLDAIEGFEPDFARPGERADYMTLLEAFEHLGGELPAHLVERSRAWTELWARMRERGHTKVGRNDPCPCGSGKKYKKCCIDVRDDTA